MDVFDRINNYCVTRFDHIKLPDSIELTPRLSAYAGQLNDLKLGYEDEFVREMEGDVLKLTKSTVISRGDAKYLYIPYELLDVARACIKNGEDVFVGMQKFSLRLCLHIQKVLVLTLL